MITPYFGYRNFSKIFYHSYLAKNDTLISLEERMFLQKLRSKRIIKGRAELVFYLIRNRRIGFLVKLFLNKILNEVNYYYNSVVRNWPLNKGSDKILKYFRNTVLRDRYERKFLFINLMDVHEPYSSDEKDILYIVLQNFVDPQRTREIASKWRSLYPREVSYIANRLRETIDFLDEENVLDESLIVVTSDHGQLLGEHGLVSHGTFLYDELLRVPLLVHYPQSLGVEQERVSEDSYNRYMSLTSIPFLISSSLKGDTESLYSIYKESVFAESYGLSHNFGRFLNENELAVIRKTYEGYKVAVYHGNAMGVFDTRLWGLSYLKGFNGEDVGERERRVLREKAISFIKKSLPFREARRF